MKVLVLGAEGQVGRAVCSMVPDGVDIVATGRSQCDLLDARQIARTIALTSPAIVINAAAYVAVDRAESEQEQARLLNAVAPGLVASAARAAGARTFHLSTDFVFSGSTGHPYRPHDPPDPINVYGRTKLAGEQAVRNADPAALVVRTAWVYSASRKNFVGTMLRLMKRGDSISVVADQVGTPTCADSLAGALWAFVATGAEGILHYTDAGVASWYDLAVAIREEAAPLGLVNGSIEIMPIGTEDYPTAARRPAYSVLDKREAWAIQGRTAPHWRVNLRRMLKGLSANG